MDGGDRGDCASDFVFGKEMTFALSKIYKHVKPLANGDQWAVEFFTVFNQVYIYTDKTYEDVMWFAAQNLTDDADII